MADQQDDTYRLPGVGERISRLADSNPSPAATARATEPSFTATASPPKATMAQELSADIARERAAVQANMASLAALSHHDHGHGAHPTAATYIKVGAILTAITVVEVIAYYVPSFVASKLFVPALLIMSAVKFFIVVAFYMHLKYDHKLFRTLFTGPLLIAALTLIGLMFLFGKLAVRLGLLT